MNPNKIVGLDLSLASTGVASTTLGTRDSGATVDRIVTRPTGRSVADRSLRLWRITEQIRLWTAGAQLVVIEGPALRLQSGSAHERAGLWWIVAHRLVSGDIPVAVVPPASRAKYATGRGNAGKDQVLAAVIKRYPTVNVEGNDQADALVLAAMGARWLGYPIERSLPEVNLAAMNGARWPELKVAA